jgi:cobalt-zinc-cadmium efflux system protein
VGVISAGLLVRLTGDGWWDTVVAVAIGVLVAVRALLLGREVLAVLGQHAPHDVDLDAVVRDLEAVPGVAELHDLHVWTLTSADAPDVLAAAGAALREGHGIEHATLQVEALPAQECHAATW